MIKIEKLCKSYKDKQILKNITLTVEKGDIFGLLGPNGAGKTTLLRILIGLTRPTSGNVFIGGYNIVKHLSKVKRLIGIAFQEDSFYDGLTGLENVLYFASLYHVNPKVAVERARNLFKLLGLEAQQNKLVAYYSGGMKKRLNIICSLVHDPPILLLDEPTAGLDPMGRRKIWQIIKKLNEMGKTILLSSHIMQDIEALCNKVAILHRGEIIAYGDIDQLKSFVKSKIIFLKVQPDLLSYAQKLLKEHGILSEIYENALLIKAEDVKRTLAIAEIALGELILDVETVTPSLEDIFHYFVGESGV